MLSCDMIREKSGASIFGNNIFCLTEVDSTNTFVLNIARSGAPEGTLVVSNFQTAGRGKQNRQWFAPRGQNMTFSVLLRPTVKIEHAQKITLAMANTLADTIEQFFSQKKWQPIQINLKWPNDLRIGEKKLCGILSESILKDKEIVALAVGIGINLNTEIKNFPPELQHNTCSLIDYSEQRIIPEELLALFLGRLEVDYGNWERNNYRDVVQTWRKRSHQIGQTISISTIDETEQVVFEDVDESGYLVYRNAKGELKQLISGDVNAISD